MRPEPEEEIVRMWNIICQFECSWDAGRLVNKGPLGLCGKSLWRCVLISLSRQQHCVLEKEVEIGFWGICVGPTWILNVKYPHLTEWLTYSRCSREVISPWDSTWCAEGSHLFLKLTASWDREQEPPGTEIKEETFQEGLWITVPMPRKRLNQTCCLLISPQRNTHTSWSSYVTAKFLIFWISRQEF